MFRYSSIKEVLFLDKVLYLYSPFFRFVELTIYSLVCLFIPIMLSHPQIMVGAVVNAILILSATYLKGYEVMPSILLPSAGVLLAGTLFASLTPFVVFMVPFIWVGNGLLVYLFKREYVAHSKNYVFVLLLSASIKSVFLGAVVLLFFFLGAVPSSLLLPFSILQIGTAILGGGLAYPIIRLRSYLVTVQNG